MELWAIVLFCAFIATWIMMVYRTWSISMYMIKMKQPKNLMIKHRTLGFIIYSLCMILLVPLIPQVAVSNRARKSFCLSYVKAITKEEK